MRDSLALRRVLGTGTALAIVFGCAGMASAQVTPPDENATQPAATPTGADVLAGDTDVTGASGAEPEILVTGSRIRQDPNNSALPLQIVTTQEIQRNGISSPEQLLAYLPINGSGSDNLASNSDVVTNERRGNNGASFANLRGQGPASTLILLNDRRVAAHGTTGAAVDVNQIPFMAIDRVEVLKDGASAIYGTDAVGGVINFITKKNYTGFGASGFTDITERGDAPIYRISAIAGLGDLDDQGFNVMATVGYSWVSPLEAHQRDFINTFQHDRGLGVDTRGTPFATIVNLAGTAFPASSAFPFLPGSTTQRATGGINLLRLPGQAGCDAIEDQGDYDTQVWGAPGNALACTFDTGRNVYLQQELETLTYLGRAVKRFGDHEISLEVTGSDADSVKRFSQIQITPNTTTQNYAYRLVPGVNDEQYARVYDTLLAAFPTLNIPFSGPNSGFAYRWRCMECGTREILTNNRTLRAVLGLEGPLFADWDYRVGASYAEAKGRSVLGQGYYYRGTLDNGQPDGGPGLIPALNSGVINPFLFPGQTQSAAGLAAIQAASAAGVELYNGKYSVKEIDGSVSGSLFEFPAGTVKMAAGVDYRRESYSFQGDERDIRRVIIGAPFDDANVLSGVHRDIKAIYAELLIPIIKGLELSAAGRIDDYTGFGTTKNPKISIKYRPVDWVMFRGSYNTAFRVPAFNQIFNPNIRSLYTGADFADPAKCPDGKVNEAAGCPSLSRLIDIVSGGNLNLRPETAKMFSAGVVFEPSRHFSASADWWSIKRNNEIQVLPLAYIFGNYDSLQDRFIRDASGTLVEILQTWGNSGRTRTRAIDFTLRGNFEALAGTVSAGLDGTWLLKKDQKVNDAAPVIDQLGVYSLAADLGIRWKHNAFVAYTASDWSLSLTQIFRSGYKNQVLPGVLAGTFDPSNDVVRVKDYMIYNLAWTYTGVAGLRWTLGVRNLFDREPPFAISYDSNNGSGSDWEPRIADPRGRSFTIAAEVKF